MIRTSRHLSLWNRLARLATVLLLTALGLAMIGAAYFGLTGGDINVSGLRSPWQSGATRLSPTPTRLEQEYNPAAVNLAATPIVTRTTKPTSTPTQTVTPTGTPDLPHEYSSLLLLSGDQLMRWDPVTNITTTLASQVIDYSISANGKKIALLRSPNIAANGVGIFDLELLDLGRNKTTTLISGIPRLYGLSISPDGKWIASSNKVDGGSIQFHRVSAPDQVLDAGTCITKPGQPCDPLYWSPDSRFLLWSDQQGLWISSPQRPDDRQLAEPEMTAIDPQGEASTLPVTFSNLDWSPNNRFVIMNASTPSGVNWLAVLDTNQGRLATVPDSLVKSGASAGAMWMKDGTLMTTNAVPSEKGAATDLLIRQWQVIATRPDLLKPVKSSRMATDLPTTASAPSKIAELKTAWPFQFGLNRLYLVVLPPQDTAHPSVYLLDLRTTRAQKLVGLPDELQGVLWSPDGRGAVILIPGQTAVYAPLADEAQSEGASLVDLSAIFGSQVSDFFWLPPAPAP
jgi:hypothetical protein